MLLDSELFTTSSEYLYGSLGTLKFCALMVSDRLYRGCYGKGKKTGRCKEDLERNIGYICKQFLSYHSFALLNTHADLVYLVQISSTI